VYTYVPQHNYALNPSVQGTIGTLLSDVVISAMGASPEIDASSGKAASLLDAFEPGAVATSGPSEADGPMASPSASTSACVSGRPLEPPRLHFFLLAEVWPDGSASMALLPLARFHHTVEGKVMQMVQNQGRG
jgi:hypothetical protein